MDTSTIAKRLKIIKDLQDEIKILREQYQDSLESDPEYQKVQEELTSLKEETKTHKNTIQDKIEDKNSFRVIKDQIKEKQEELKSLNEILSHELVEYYRETGETKIEDAEGNVKKIKFSVKLVS